MTIHFTARDREEEAAFSIQTTFGHPILAESSATVIIALILEGFVMVKGLKLRIVGLSAARVR